ncbi:MAG: cbb3-type cytochrome c oxidase subunit I [Sulfurimonas sp.]|nr:cbb3-type cytochrome c oxidase subunit I [Sulfurimonas sp.]
MLKNLWEQWVMRPSKWWITMILLVFVIGGGSMIYVGMHTYSDAPPRVDFVNSNGEVIVSKEQIIQGQLHFLRYGLMNFGSMFGDGALRGPDFTADALHKVTVSMKKYHISNNEHNIDEDILKDSTIVKVQREIKNNLYDEEKQSILLTPSQEFAFNSLVKEYSSYFRDDVSHYQRELENASDKELQELSSFFFWGAWVCGAKRPGFDYSYTHNWPFDEEAGNTPTSNILLWSVLAVFGLILALGLVLYLHGRYSEHSGWNNKKNDSNDYSSLSTLSIEQYMPSVMQKTTYKFFLAASLLFVLQIGFGVLSVHNFIGLDTIFGIDVNAIVSLVAARSLHLQLGLLWITATWIGISFFLISSSPHTNKSKSQMFLVNLLFWAFLIMTIGVIVGILLPIGALPGGWNWLGNQGWEYIEMGRFWQWIMFGIFILWSSILFKDIYPRWSKKRAWELKNWLFYCVTIITLLFISAFIAEPETNFVIADFWRWAVIHMWVEAFFEMFVTIVLVYMVHLMGFLPQAASSRIIYLAALLFLGSGLLGISHNFYWNAKPMAILAIGSIFSTLQIIPLILVALEVWKFRKMPQNGIQKGKPFKQKVAFYFLLSVNFWNFFGAGVLGFLINLPIVNYYQHGTYLTVNHAHAAFMGVYGNISIGAMIFVARYLVIDEMWNEKLLMRIFWSINIGLMLMVMIDLFPAGIHQLISTLDNGLWYSRSEEFIQGDVFQALTFSRMIGGFIFVFGGVLPLAWFMLTRFRTLKRFK